MANVHAFPPSFCFPAAMSERHRRRLVGNSLNVLVVAELINFMLDL